MQLLATHCNTLQHTATHCNTCTYESRHSWLLQQNLWNSIASNAATRCNTLQHKHCDYESRHSWLLQQNLWHSTASNTLQHVATHCNTLKHTATPFNTLQHTATHCNTLQHTVTHCNTHILITNQVKSFLTTSAKFMTCNCTSLQHTATHCNTLQHTATHTPWLRIKSFLTTSTKSMTFNCQHVVGETPATYSRLVCVSNNVVSPWEDFHFLRFRFCVGIRYWGDPRHMLAFFLHVQQCRVALGYIVLVFYILGFVM